MTINSAATIETMSHSELIAYAKKLEWDSAFSCLKREAGELRLPIVSAGYTLLFIDIADMHGANHKYTMAMVDGFIQNVINDMRYTDIVYRHGGDEIVCVLKTDNISAVIDRIDSIMSANNLYGVYAAVFCNNNTPIANAVKRGDQAVMAIKSALDSNGKKAGRKDTYVKRDSVRVFVSA